MNIHVINNGIIYSHIDQIDTFKIEKGIYQKDKKLPISSIFINSSATFNIGGTRRNYRNNYTVQYIKDSLYSYLDQEVERIHIFHLYPIIFRSEGSERIIDSSEFSNPLILGVSAKNGIPVYAATTKTFFKEPHLIESMECYNWIKVRGISRKKLEHILR